MTEAPGLVTGASGLAAGGSQGVLRRGAASSRGTLPMMNEGE